MPWSLSEGSLWGHPSLNGLLKVCSQALPPCPSLSLPSESTWVPNTSTHFVTLLCQITLKVPGLRYATSSCRDPDLCTALFNTNSQPGPLGRSLFLCDPLPCPRPWEGQLCGRGLRLSRLANTSMAQRGQQQRESMAAVPCTLLFTERGCDLCCLWGGNKAL